MKNKKSILFVGHSYYHNYYLSRELRMFGWKTDVLNIDLNPDDQMYYHGSDYIIHQKGILGTIKNLLFFFRSLLKYKIFHFSNAEGMYFPPFDNFKILQKIFGIHFEIKLLKFFGKFITYSNNACRDGVSQTSFNKWKPYPVCDSCSWKNNKDVCSDEKNLKWGRFRNKYADFIGTLGGNRVDFNNATHVFEAPWIYSLDKNVWKPDLLIPSNYKLPYDSKTIKVYHSVGNFDTRVSVNGVDTIKSTELWLKTIDRLKADGYDIEIIFFNDVPNKKIKYFQSQADIFIDMLTFGWFGANIREAMMLGKPSICFLRPEWLKDMSKEIPEYVDELPVISATPETAYTKLKWLIDNPEKRIEIGKKMREFGVKWHSSDNAAIRADEIFTDLINNG